MNLFDFIGDTELNSNIRCIEISTIDLEDIGFGELNSNIRCIEIIITGYR